MTSPTPPRSEREIPTVSSRLVEVLHDLGVRQAFGVIGGAIFPFCAAVAGSEIEYLHCRHEAGAGFAALEASLATGRPTLVFTTGGPGLTNALTAMVAARWDGAHVILVSASTSPAHRGRVATQETGLATLPSGLFLSGAPFHFAAILEHPDQMEAIASALARGLLARGGFVAHISLPIALQRERVSPARSSPLERVHLPVASPETADFYARLLADHRFVIWLGFGARHAAPAVRALAERTGAPVMCSPRAKGIFPEDHPLFLGVTGLGGHDEVDHELARFQPDHVLVLGTRMGESTSFWAPEQLPAISFVHVDADAAAFGAAYPAARTHGVVSDIDGFLRRLLVAWDKDQKPCSAGTKSLPAPATLSLRGAGPVRPQALLASVQRVFVDDSDAIVLSESGNSFCWTTNLLRFRTPGRYRVSTGFGSMGHAATGVVGAALARKGKAVAIVGDGSMLMLNEVSTAVQYRADAVWVVLNDARYLMCEQGMNAMGVTPFGTDLPRTDFVALARALGADGIHVTREVDLESALRCAAAARGPFVVDVDSDPHELAPSGKRNRILMKQGFREGAGAE